MTQHKSPFHSMHPDETPEHPPVECRKLHRAAFTLIELVTSLAISTIIVTAMGSAIMVASAAIPTAETETVANADAQLDWISIEVSEAESIKTATGAELTFTVPDRSGNGQPELISYTWNGSAGSPLYRTYNANAPEVVIDSLDAFAVSAVSSPFSLGVTPDITRERVEQVAVSVQPAGSKRSLKRTVSLPNTPPLLDLWVRTDFDSDPILLDRDHSGSVDWYKFGTYDNKTVKDGWWHSLCSMGVKSPGNFTSPVTASARVWFDTRGDTATLDLAVDVADFQAANLRLTITKNRNDLSIVLDQFSSFGWQNLISTTSTGYMVDFTLVVEPVSDTVTLILNGTVAGSATYSRLGAGTSGAALFGHSGNWVYYDWLDVRVGGISK